MDNEKRLTNAKKMINDNKTLTTIVKQELINALEKIHGKK